MKALLIIAHGSRRKESNEEVRRLSSRITENAGPAFDLVMGAFLEDRVSTSESPSGV